MARKPPEQTVDYNGNMVSPAWQGTETHAKVRNARNHIVFVANTPEYTRDRSGQKLLKNI